MWRIFWDATKDFFTYLGDNVFYSPETDVKTLSMNQEAPPQPQNAPINDGIDVLRPWDTFDNCRHNVRVICDWEGLSMQDKNDLSSTVHCESNYNPKCIHPNVIAGKVTSTDYGIAQINDYWHIGPGKDFPSADYVLNNPEACIRYMCQKWKAGEQGKKLWVCYQKGLFHKYAA